MSRGIVIDGPPLPDSRALAPSITYLPVIFSPFLLKMYTLQSAAFLWLPPAP